MWQTSNITMLQKAYILSVSAIVLVMPFPMLFQNILFPVAAFFWLFQGKSNWTFAYHKITWLFLAFWLLHVCSVLNSDNTKEAWHIVERRLPFIAFPILFMHPLMQQHLGLLKKTFVLGVLTSCLVCFFVASISCVETQSSEVFFYHTLAKVVGINAVYLAMYCLMALVLISLNALFSEGLTRFFKVLLLTFIVMLNSKLCLVLTLLFLIHQFYVSRNWSAKKMVLGIAVLLLSIVSLALIPAVNKRFSAELATKMSVVNQQTYAYDTPFTGTSLRLVLWKKSLTIVKENNAWLWGVGTGDFQDLLNEQYKACGMYTGNPALHDTGYLGYGPHNQYIEVWLCMGVLGLCLFSVLLYYLIKQVATGNNEQLYFLLICLLFFVTESVLSTNKGVVFFCFFVCLLWGGHSTSKINFVKKN